MLQYIVPTKQLLFQWKIANNKQCNYCKQEEDYCHYFITCPFLLNFWRRMYEVLRKSRLEFKVTLKHLVFWYKIFDEDYFLFKLFSNDSWLLKQKVS